jgi:hypothetical protein
MKQGTQLDEIMVLTSAEDALMNSTRNGALTNIGSKPNFDNAINWQKHE